MTIDPRSRLAAVVRVYAEGAAHDGSPLYGLLLGRAAADIAAGGPCWDALLGAAAANLRAVPALQLMGAVHHLVLTGAAPALARFYPSAGGAAPRDPAAEEAAWVAFRALVSERQDLVRALARRPVQTNEVGRSAALLGGFLIVARETGLTLRLLELGSSAGLNLRWDAYRYESGDLAWGKPTAPVRFNGVYVGDGRPPLDVPARVAERAGCDRNPLDPNSQEDQLTLLSYVWADQIHRIQRLRAALDLARALPAPIEASSAPDWLAARLAEPCPGLATVVFHSIVLGYLTPEERAQTQAALLAAGARATPAAPLAWLRMEPDARGAPEASIRLTLWPGGEEHLLALAGYHGQYVRWLAG